MRVAYHAALGLIVTASFSLPGFAAEPDGPATLITRTEAVRISVQDPALGQVLGNERAQGRARHSREILRGTRPKLTLDGPVPLWFTDREHALVNL